MKTNLSNNNVYHHMMIDEDYEEKKQKHNESRFLGAKYFQKRKKRNLLL